MTLNLSSSAPHIFPVAQWEQLAENSRSGAVVRDEKSRITGIVLHKSATPALEIGIRRWYCGSIAEAFEIDELRHFITGRAVFRGDNGEVIEVEPRTAVHFKQGWRGTAEIHETLDATHVRCEGGQADNTPVLRHVLTAGSLKEWGPVSKPLEGPVSLTAGILLSREPDRRAESGIWTCTPGLWRCELKSDEFCHFLQGSSTYTHDGGEVIEVQPDTLAYFPKGWKGQCRVHETVRKVYLIR
jgi:hypothetical protein